jgi:hypothetical protein
MAYVLELVPDGNAEDAFQTLATHTRRNDGHSYISKDASWMSNPYHLMHGWYLEGRTSLEQKKDILQKLTRLGLSQRFVNCADDFVEGRSIKKYLPTEEDAAEIMRMAGDTEEA